MPFCTVSSVPTIIYELENMRMKKKAFFSKKPLEKYFKWEKEIKPQVELCTNNFTEHVFDCIKDDFL